MVLKAALAEVYLEDEPPSNCHADVFIHDGLIQKLYQRAQVAAW